MRVSIFLSIFFHHAYHKHYQQTHVTRFNDLFFYMKSIMKSTKIIIYYMQGGSLLYWIKMSDGWKLAKHQVYQCINIRQPHKIQEDHNVQHEVDYFIIWIISSQETQIKFTFICMYGLSKKETFYSCLRAYQSINATYHAYLVVFKHLCTFSLDIGCYRCLTSFSSGTSFTSFQFQIFFLASQNDHKEGFTHHISSRDLKTSKYKYICRKCKK